MPTVLINLLLTILAELPVHLVGLRKRPPLQVVLVCVLLNGFSQPLATWLYFSFPLNYWAMEGGVTIVEGLLLMLAWQMKPWQALLLSAVANAASIGLGALIFR